MPKRRLMAVGGALLVLATTPGGAGANPGPATHVDAVTATLAGTSVQVSGTATFVDVPAIVGSDAVGDAVAPVPGTDVTTLRIARPNPAANTLVFTMSLADQPPAPVSGPPVVVYYSWEIGVTPPGGDTSVTKILQANRLQGTAVPNTNPTIRVLTYNASGACGCTQVGLVSGKMADGVIEWQVPFTFIGASGGDSLAQQGVIGPLPGAGAPGAGNTWVPGGNLDPAMMDSDYVIPAPAVQLGMAPAGTPEGSVPLTTTASVTPATGAFAGSLQAPAVSGDYVVVARACYGATNCGLASTTVTL